MLCVFGVAGRGRGTLSSDIPPLELYRHTLFPVSPPQESHFL
jgi:hypothetical protein